MSVLCGHQKFGFSGASGYISMLFMISGFASSTLSRSFDMNLRHTLDDDVHEVQ